MKGVGSASMLVPLYSAECAPPNIRGRLVGIYEIGVQVGTCLGFWINYGVQPQVMPRMIGLGLYRFDINFRESAVVGIVGGGGIGATLNTAFDRYEFDSAAAILLIIIAIVMVVEYSSGYLRRWVQ